MLFEMRNMASRCVAPHHPHDERTTSNQNQQLQGYNAQKASFSSTINVKQIGHSLLTLTPPGENRTDPAQKERYLITLPALHIEGLIYGSPFVELEKTTRIASSTGYIAKIDYSGKGWLSGKKNTFNAILYKESEGEKHPLYTVEGQWSDTFVIKNTRTKETEKYMAKAAKTAPFELAPVQEQDLYESRRAWREVAAAIERGDMDAVSANKSRIENAQRQLRKVEKEQGREWERRFFDRVDEKQDPALVQLARKLDYSGALEADKTGGVWRFVPEKAKDVQKPYHKGGGPEGLGISAEEFKEQIQQQQQQ